MSNAKISHVRNLNTGKLEPADFHLLDEEKFSRFKLNIERGKLNYVCEFCGTKIKVKAGSYTKELVNEDGLVVRKGYNTDPHWYHSEYGDEKVKRCPYYEESSRGGGYSPESTIHFDTKIKLAYWLEKTPGVSSVEVEKYIISRVDQKRRKPDVSFLFNGLRYSFEVQHSYLSPSDVVNRTDFFRKNKVVNFWIFPFVSPQDLTSHHKDLFFDNLHNLHVFDAECEIISAEVSKLVIKTWFKRKLVTHRGVFEKWVKKISFLKDYSIGNGFVPYVFDVEKEAVFFNLKMQLMEIENEINELNRIIDGKRLDIRKKNELLNGLRSELESINSDCDKIKASINKAMNDRRALVADYGLEEDRIKKINELDERIKRLKKEEQSVFSEISKWKKYEEDASKIVNYWDRNIKEKQRIYKGIFDKLNEHA